MAPRCARPDDLEPIRIPEPPFTSFSGLRAVGKFRINQLRPLGKGGEWSDICPELSKGIDRGWGNCVWWWEGLWE